MTCIAGQKLRHKVQSLGEIRPGKFAILTSFTPSFYLESDFHHLYYIYTILFKGRLNKSVSCASFIKKKAILDAIPPTIFNQFNIANFTIALDLIPNTPPTIIGSDTCMYEFQIVMFMVFSMMSFLCSIAMLVLMSLGINDDKGDVSRYCRSWEVYWDDPVRRWNTKCHDVSINIYSGPPVKEHSPHINNGGGSK